MDFLKEHGETDTLTLSASLNINEEIIRSWVDVLDKAGIVRVTQRFDRIFVSFMPVKEEQLVELEQSLEAQKASLGSQLYSHSISMVTLKERINALGRNASGVEQLYASSIGTLKDDIAQLDALELEAERNYKSIEAQKEKVERFAATIDKQLGELKAISDKMGATSSSSLAMKMMQEIENRAKQTEMQVDEMQHNFEQNVAEQRKTLKRISDGIHEDMRSVREETERERRNAAQSEMLEREYKRESVAVKLDFERSKSSILNESTRAKQGIEQTHSIAEKKFGEIKSEIDRFRKQFGEFAVLDKQIKGLRESIDNMKKDADELGKEIETLGGELKAIDLIKAEEPKKKNDEIRKLTGRVSQLKPKVEKLKKDVEDSEKGEESK